MLNRQLYYTLSEMLIEDHMFQHWRRGNTQDAACDNSGPWGHALRRGKQFLQVIGLIYCL